MARKILLSLWLLACCAVLVFVFISKDIKDADIVFIYAMYVLTFPSGFIVQLVFIGVSYISSELFNYTIPSGPITNLFAWLLFIIIGYLQWFKLVPWVYMRLFKSSPNKSLKEGSAESAAP